MPRGKGKTSGVSPVHRHPSGAKKRAAATPRAANPGTVWRRIKDNWRDMEKIGMNPDLGSEIARLYLFGVLTEVEASAGRLYAEICGRFHRYHGVARASAPSPAYERGHGREDEVERNIRQGTVSAYERRAKAAKRAWTKLQRSVPNAPSAHDLLHRVCVLNEHAAERDHVALKLLLRKVADAFGLGGKGAR